MAAKFTPHPFLRHITPWWLLCLIDKHLDTCWANIVLWKQFGSDCSWWPDGRCFKPYDYCGKYEGRPRPAPRRG